MKAVVINQFGGPEVLTLVEMDKPKIKETEILIEVHACGLNPVDYKIRKGDLNEVFPVTFPRVLGGDISGVVSAVGSQVTDFKVGDEIYCANKLDKEGAYAEFVAVEQEIVAKKPETLSYIEAAGLPVAALTAVQTLRDFCELKAGQKVLIHAGAGGVGSLAIQYAKYLGAEVYTTGSSLRKNYLQSLGADRIIDYHSEDFVKVCNDAGGMDCVLEAVGGVNYPKSLLATKKGGVVVSIVNPPDADTLTLSHDRKIKTDFMLLSSSRQDLDIIRDLVDKKIMNVSISRTYKMEELQEAHKDLETGRTQGKLVLEVHSK